MSLGLLNQVMHKFCRLNLVAEYNNSYFVTSIKNASCVIGIKLMRYCACIGTILSMVGNIA